MKVGRRRRRISKSATKIQDRTKRATVRAVNKRTIKHAGLNVLKGKNRLLSRKKAHFKSRLTYSKLVEVGITKGKSSNGTGNIIARPVKKIGFKRNRIVRIMGHGQFTISTKILMELSKVDSAMVEIVRYDHPNDDEFRKCLEKLTDIVRKFGKPHNSKEIVRSDIILPSVDLSNDEAKKLFKGEGVIPVV